MVMGEKERTKEAGGKKVWDTRQMADLLLLLAQLEQQIWMNLEVPDSQHDGRGTGVMPSKQQVQACILHHQHHIVKKRKERLRLLASTWLKAKYYIGLPATLLTAARKGAAIMLLYRQDRVRQKSMANTKTTKLHSSLEKASHAQRNQYGKNSTLAVSSHNLRPA